ncbi:TIGR02594 family protein [Salinihabitans flavidus]|uniref:TIGR02594 family protein n=1 Tax=Salinihabitans flavidus TaxID=569882 RepID=A0A1H8WIZ1_9RHOB|nr:peptidoglycan-binding protein [Salinihabitans flavidus]SEP27654.1 TIGR02594 family protein [Salinihabitans flavidus]
MTSQSYDVRWLQRALASLGHYSGAIDGIAGPKTRAAIVAFKRAEGLRARPYIGPITLSRLRDAVDEPAPDRVGPESAPEPPWLVEISKYLGLHEVRDNAALRDWLRSDGATLGDPAQLPWCGDAAATALRKALPEEPFPPKLARNPYWARNFADLGIRCGHVYGAIIVFSRGKGGHVGFAIGRDPDRRRYLVRGGNQGDEVRDSWMAESRLLALRWPRSWPTAHQRALPRYDASGAVLSVNEA